MKTLTSMNSKSFNNDFELSNALTNNRSIINDIDLNNSNQKSNSIISEIQRIKSPNNIKQISKLHHALIKLEKNCSNTIAEKYLAGFLEDKGVRSFKEYISGLV